MFVNKSGTMLDFTLTVSPADLFAIAGVASTAFAEKPLAKTAAAFMSTFSTLPAPVGQARLTRSWMGCDGTIIRVEYHQSIFVQSCKQNVETTVSTT